MSNGTGHSPRTLLSFLVIGGIGFAIDAIVLTLLTQWALWTPLQARIPSFLTAVLATWALNRWVTFPNRGLQRRSLEALLYTGIQAGGVVINLLTFAICLALVPQLNSAPVIPLAAGSAVACSWNYLMSSRLLYAR